MASNRISATGSDGRRSVKNRGTVQGVGRPVSPIEYARRCMEQGLGFLARAVNHQNNPDLPYRYSPADQERFRRLALEIIDIVEHGEIVPRVGAMAQADVDFQRFMAVVCGAPSR